MKIVVYPDKILRKKSEIIEESPLEDLYRKMITVMINNEGIGLAGPQVGINKRIAVISEKADDSLSQPLLLINPVIVERKGNQKFDEACLSVLGINGIVTRSETVTVETGFDSDRSIIEATGIFAVVLQHEIDHLNGILFIDRLKNSERLWKLFKARLNKLNDK